MTLRTYLLAFTLFCTARAFAQSPNIVFIIGDDISWDDIGPYATTRVKNPGLEKLTREGIQFTNMYLTTSSCSPSRISILTGRYPHNTGAAELHTPMPAHLPFLPEQLKKNGYYTALAGKWHEGPTSKRGYDTLLVDKKANGEGGEEQWVNLLKSRPKDKPFFFWFAALDAHRPWSAETNGPRHIADNIKVPPTLLDNQETRADLTYYYDEISRLDYYVEAVMFELDQQGIADNTLIVFMADNGRAFPGSKTRLYDAGIKTPFIVKWPKGIKSSSTCESLVSAIDIAPTLLEIAGASVPETMQGKSFAKLFKSPEQEFRKYVFAEHNWHDYAAYERSVRTKDFLFVSNQMTHLDNGGPIDANQSPSAKSLKSAAPSGQLSLLQKDALLKKRPAEEFFDVFKDPLQSRNEIGNTAYHTSVTQLRAVLSQWQKETGDTFPQNLTPDWYDRETGDPLPANGKRGEMPGKSANAERINAKGPF